ncbi:MAG: DNA repair protein RadA, partial [Desulfosarcinaceae bacterium]
VDLAALAAIASSYLDKPVPGQTLVLGEVGLAGEVRAIGNMETRLAEARKMGFTRCIAPGGSLKRIKHPEDIELVGVLDVEKALEVLF